MAFAPHGNSPFLPGKNNINIDSGKKNIIDRSLFLRKANNKIVYNKCSDKELQELLEKNEKLLKNKEILDNLPDKGEKIHQKNKEIRDEMNRRNIKINIKEENGGKKNKMEVVNEENKENENHNSDDMEVINEQLQSIKISVKNEKEITNNSNTKIKHGQAKISEKILNNSILNNKISMIPHKPNKSHSKIISIEESLEIQARQRKIAKEKEMEEAIKKLKKSTMSTGPVNIHSTKYRDHVDENGDYYNYSDDDSSEDSYSDDDDDDNNENSDDNSGHEDDKYH